MRLGLLQFLWTAQAVSVLTSPWQPMVSCVVGSANFSTFSGYDMDLLRHIASVLHWTDLEVRCMEYPAMMSTIEAGQADMAMAGITIQSDRLNVSQFSTPTYDSCLVLVTRVNRGSLTWVLFSPFHYLLWIVLGGSGLLLGHFLWVVERREGGGIRLEYRKGILAALWVVYTQFFFAAERTVSSVPGRLLQLFMGLSAFLIFGLYVGNLTARLTMPFLEETISSYKDLEGRRIGTADRHRKVMGLFSNQIVVFDWDNGDPSLRILAALQAGDIEVAALERPQAVYYSIKECGLTVLDFSFVDLYYAAMFPLGANAAFISQVSLASQMLKENSLQEALMNKYVNNVSNVTCSSLYVLGAFDIGDLSGICLLLVAGLSLSGVVYAFQTFLKRQSNEQRSQVSIKNAFRKSGKTFTAEMDLVKKFDRILMSADQKIGEKLEELEKKLQEHLSTSVRYEEAMKDLSLKLDKRFS